MINQFLNKVQKLADKFIDTHEKYYSLRRPLHKFQRACNEYSFYFLQKEEAKIAVLKLLDAYPLTCAVELFYLKSSIHGEQFQYCGLFYGLFYPAQICSQKLSAIQRNYFNENKIVIREEKGFAPAKSIPYWRKENELHVHKKEEGFHPPTPWFPNCKEYYRYANSHHYNPEMIATQLSLF